MTTQNARACTKQACSHSLNNTTSNSGITSQSRGTSLQVYVASDLHASLHVVSERHYLSYAMRALLFYCFRQVLYVGRKSELV